ncbi:glutamine synthetase family protein [Aneurinibacillus sp. Ricciae_BoGa-3]|uniref:glutamine synthetase family protein n=1 Tax=Aneurinibacillus sp. Ricciae_BoGa-3 TaxID=3022697 RepID=UPI0023419AC5|nr:glutamine synthetase family protein [Aneurinibacillus sp. Ricciae_BoGa-3]WCK56544.1 glutamine synthetase family protein [Aneurinibacillus sp. Ricciae_BoGa-3]
MTAEEWKQYIQRLLRENNIHTIRMCLPDHTNISRSRNISSAHFLQTVLASGASYPSVLFSMDTSAKIRPELGSGFDGGYPSWLFEPDPKTFSILPYAPGIARIIGDVYETDGSPVSVAPRHVLRRVLDEIKQMGFQVYGAFEYEFYAFQGKTNPPEPAWEGLQLFSEFKQAEVQQIFTAAMLSLSEMGAGPQIANTEYGSGQFEITHEPFWDIEIADMAFYYRTSIREILQQKGLRVTFMSKPFTDMSGSGSHLNLSLYNRDKGNVFYDNSKPDGLSDICRWFLAGQLHHAAALCALSNPTVNSYKRLVPYSFAPTTATWGYENRTAMIRIPHILGNGMRIENRLPGADTNPYLTLAATLAAGLDGIRRQLEPPAPLERSGYESGSKLPRSLGEALLALGQDELFHDLMGSEFVEHTLKLRTAEWERFSRHVTDWETAEYMDLF